jgi:hypothetical protein
MSAVQLVPHCLWLLPYFVHSSLLLLLLASVCNIVLNSLLNIGQKFACMANARNIRQLQTEQHQA